MVFKSGVFDPQVFDVTKVRKMELTVNNRKVKATFKKIKIKVELVKP